MKNFEGMEGGWFLSYNHVADISPLNGSYGPFGDRYPNRKTEEGDPMMHEILFSDDIDDSHFIPFNRETIIKMLLDDDRLNTTEKKEFEKFCHLLKNIYHFEFHEKLENLKLYYDPFNPNSENENKQNEKFQPFVFERKFLTSLSELLADGNYTEVSDIELKNALNSQGIFPVNSFINFDAFEYYKIYFQGEALGKVQLSSWIPFKKKEVEFQYFKRVILVFKVKSVSISQKKKKRSSVGSSRKIYLKFFRNIPKADLEMIFPDPQPRMKLLDKIKIMAPLIIGTGISVKELFVDPYLLKTTQGPLEKGISVELLVILAGLFGYAYKAYESYKQIVQNFLREISQGLYFRDIGNNEAVVTALIDEAEEQECMETMLGYYFLLLSKKPLKTGQLDRLIEKWMEETHYTKVNFDVADALNKIVELGILKRNETGEFSVPTLDDALEKMDNIWDSFFHHRRA